MTKILIIDGHPDPAPKHFVHAICRAYAKSAREAGHRVRKIRVGQLDFPMLREPSDWLEGAPPPVIAKAQADFSWAEHAVIVYPLWLGDVPGLLKGLLEQVMRPGFALAYRDKGFPKKLLAGRSARVVVTMGMPGLFYSLVYRAHSLKSLERNILAFVGFKPVHHTIVGWVEDAERREAALAEIRELGAKAG